MPEQETLVRARRARREGKARSTQAGEFVREEIRHVREGVHGARSAKQAIAIGLSKARRAGVKLPPPEKGRTSERVRRRAMKDYRSGQGDSARAPSRARSRATLGALRRESARAATHLALSRQARNSSRHRSAKARSAAARKAARTRAALS